MPIIAYEWTSGENEVGEVNQRRADIVVSFLVAAILVVGGALGWQAYRQQQAFEQMGSMMGMSMGSVHGTNPLWYFLGTLLVSAVISGGYLIVRDELTSIDTIDRSRHETKEPNERESSEPPAISVESTGPINPETQPEARVLDLLPDNERRILEPVLSSPGITQIELRDRSDFSKSKVSQTASDLEKRGLLYRERQGRTYRIYPSDDLQQSHE
nr:MarR family transcriptional regulator [Natrinema sp. 1APR25-10V2]